MKTQEGQGEIFEEIGVDRQWFHVVRSMIGRGKIAEMGVNAWAVYSVLKSHTNMKTGKSWPSQATIAELIGVSVDTVARATDKLVEMGIITKTRVGRHSEYTINEEFPIVKADTREMVGRATHTYVPLEFQRQIEDIVEAVRSGIAPEDRSIRIELNINFIQQGDNSTVNIGTVRVEGENGRIPADIHDLASARTLLNRIR